MADVDTDYPPAIAEGDDEEQQRQLLAGTGFPVPPAVAPAAAPGTPGPSFTPAPAARNPEPPEIGGAPPLPASGVPGANAPMPGSAPAPPSLSNAIMGTIGKPRPQPSDYPAAELHGWKKALGALFTGMAGFRNPAMGAHVYSQLFEQPKLDARQKYETEAAAWDKQYAAELNAEREEREGRLSAATINAENTRAVPPEPKTVETAEGVFAFNPATGRYDTRVGGPKGKTNQVLGDQAQTLNQQLLRRWQVLNPGQPLPPEYGVGPNSTQTDYERADKALESAERASGVKAQQDIASGERARGEGEKKTTEDNKQYNFFVAKIAELRKPVADRAERFSRLADTLEDGNPQSDALVAPELLSLMAGGQASGLRMNEAEISRIVGGRNKWGDLRAKIEAWRLDPNKGFALTPAQRQQVQKLMHAVGERIQSKLDLVDKASEELLDGKDTRSYREAYTKLQRGLTDLDRPRSEQSGGNRKAAPRTPPATGQHTNGPQTAEQWLEKHGIRPHTNP
jgi:hypothetical protein